MARIELASFSVLSDVVARAPVNEQARSFRGLRS